MYSSMLRRQSSCLRQAAKPGMWCSMHHGLISRTHGTIQASTRVYQPIGRRGSNSRDSWISSSSSSRKAIRCAAGRGVTQTATHSTSSQDPESASHQQQQQQQKPVSEPPISPPSSTSMLGQGQQSSNGAPRRVASQLQAAAAPSGSSVAAVGAGAGSLSDFKLSAQQLRQMVESAMDGSSSSAAAVAPEEVAAGVCSNLTLGISGGAIDNSLAS